MNENHDESFETSKQINENFYGKSNSNTNNGKPMPQPKITKAMMDKIINKHEQPKNPSDNK